MNSLEKAITDALSTNGRLTEANKAYLEFIKANFIVPIEKNLYNDEPRVLFLSENNFQYLPVFSNMESFNLWAKSIEQNIQLLKLSGVDLLKGLGENVIVCLNIGSDHYKEFNAAELARMRSMVLKFFG